MKRFFGSRFIKPKNIFSVIFQEIKKIEFFFFQIQNIVISSKRVLPIITLTFIDSIL